MKLILVGYGAWAKKYEETISKIDYITLKIAHRADWRQAIDDGADGVIVCTPPSSHVEIATYALGKNIPTMIEKPLSLSHNEALILKEFQAPILVNNIHLFSENYNKLKSIINDKRIEINKIGSAGFNKGPIREYSGLWDYGSHDLSMILDITKKFPQEVWCEEVKTKDGSLYGIRLDFANGLSTESLVGNGGKKSVRKFTVISNGLSISYDGKVSNNYTSPLTNAINKFYRIICEHQAGWIKDDSSLNLSLNVVKILEMCEQSLLNKDTVPTK